MTKHIYQDDFDFEYYDYSTEAQIMEKERQQEQEFQKMQKESVSFLKLAVFMSIVTILLFASLQGVVFLFRRLLGL